MACYGDSFTFFYFKSPVEMQPEILDILLKKVHAVYVDWRAGFSSCCECDMDRLGFLSFYPSFL
jgi:hypothetical protein